MSLRRISQPIGSFKLDLILRGGTVPPDQITQALGRQPYASMREGQVIGSITRKSNVWFCHFQEGNDSETFGNALEEFLAFLKQHENFLDDFELAGGEIELVISQVVSLEEWLPFELTLEPYFLLACGHAGVKLCVQAWTPDEEAGDEEAESQGYAPLTPPTPLPPQFTNAPYHPPHQTR